MGTDEITTTNGGIDKEEQAAITESLFLYYSGQVHIIADALTQVKGISTGTYYRRREELPDEILRIQKEARAQAREYIAGQRQALDAEAVQFSKELQLKAREHLESGLEMLGVIVRGEIQEFDLGEKNRDGTPKIKRVVPYPRDMTAAMNILQMLARGGVLPEGKITLPLVSAQTEEEPEPPVIPMLGIGTDFRRVSATAVDGTTYTAEVVPGEVLEGEIVEDGQQAQE